MSNPSQHTLRALLHYVPETGLLFWQKRSQDTFANPRFVERWNTRYAGQEAFTYTGPDGYRRGNILKCVTGKPLLAHRVIWCMVHGTYPTQIDHINGARSDNRLINLRQVNNLVNHQNVGVQRNNTTGVPGVQWYKSRKKWYAEIHANRKRISLGYFRNFEDAVAARLNAEKEHGFHPNHAKRRAFDG